MTALTIVNIVTRASQKTADTLPHVFQNPVARATHQLASAVERAAAENINDDNPRATVEYDFLASVAIEDLTLCFSDRELMRLMGDLIHRRFSDTIKIQDDGGPRTLRVGRAIIERQEALNIDVGTDVPTFEGMYRDYEAFRRTLSTIPIQDAANQSAIGPGQQPAIGAGSSADAGSGNGGYDAAKVRRTVQSQFTTDKDSEGAKFSGDIAKAPAFDLWEARYRALMSGFPGLPQKDQVLLLAEALDGDALRYFFTSIKPSSARAGMSLEDNSLGDSYANLASDASTLSAALNLIEQEFLTRDARNVLRQELLQTSLSGIMRDYSCGRVEALHKLRARIDRLSANGPSEYRSERTKIDILKNSLRGEKWAVDTLVQCQRDKGLTKLQDHVSALISYLRTLESIDPHEPASPQVASGPHGMPASVYYGYQYARPPVSTRPQGRRQRTMPGGGSHVGRSGRARQIGADGSGQRDRHRAQDVMSRDELKKHLNDQTCWLCGNVGHYSYECPTRKRSFTDAARAFLTDSDDGKSSAEELAYFLASQLDTQSDVLNAALVEGGEGDEGDAQEDAASDEERAVQEMFATFMQTPDSDFC